MEVKIFELRLDVKNPDLPFSVQKSIAVSSGDLVKVFSQFQLELVKLLRDMHEEELATLKGDDDIPF